MLVARSSEKPVLKYQHLLLWLVSSHDLDALNGQYQLPTTQITSQNHFGKTLSHFNFSNQEFTW